MRDETKRRDLGSFDSHHRVASESRELQRARRLQSNEVSDSFDSDPEHEGVPVLILTRRGASFDSDTKGRSFDSDPKGRQF
jgi:hypothetical protein